MQCAVRELGNGPEKDSLRKSFSGFDWEQKQDASEENGEEAIEEALNGMSLVRGPKLAEQKMEQVEHENELQGWTKERAFYSTVREASTLLM